MPDQCDSSLRCGAESSDLPAVIECTAGAMIFQISASAMMDDVNLISPPIFIGENSGTCQPRDVLDRH